MARSLYSIPRKAQKECGTPPLPESSIKAPNAVLDTDEAFATRRIHESAKLIDCAVISRRELEHRLNTIKREPAEVREHALDELTVISYNAPNARKG